MNRYLKQLTYKCFNSCMDYDMKFCTRVNSILINNIHEPKMFLALMQDKQHNRGINNNRTQYIEY